MREYALFLRLLADRVFDARLSAGIKPLQDATDFREWLLESADKMERAKTLEEFFDALL
jgi:hypothetical protein